MLQKSICFLLDLLQLRGFHVSKSQENIAQGIGSVLIAGTGIKG